MKKFLKLTLLALLTIIMLLPIACNNATNDSNNGETTGGNTDGGTTITPFAITTAVEDGYTSATEGTETIYTITKSGEYTFTGDLTGYVVFDSTLTESCTVNLSNCSITSTKQAIYWSAESKKLTLNVVESTTSKLTNTITTIEEKYSVIESENNLDIEGAGTLNIVGNQKHAVKASEIAIKDTVNITMVAPSDGLHAKAISIEGGNISIDNCQDAMQAELNSKSKKGTISVTGGTTYVKNCENVAIADTSITVTEGATIVVTTCTNIYTSPASTVAEGVTTVDNQIYNLPIE